MRGKAFMAGFAGMATGLMPGFQILIGKVKAKLETRGKVA
jgi:hypothetical protein